MQPIFGDMLKMWADMGYDLPMKEGRFWLENNFIQGFTPDGEMHKLYKYKVNSDLSIEITPYRTSGILPRLKRQGFPYLSEFGSRSIVLLY